MKFELSEKTKAILLILSVLAAALGFGAIAGLIGDFDKDYSTIFTAVSSAISVIVAYFKKVQDTIKNPKGE